MNRAGLPTSRSSARRTAALSGSTNPSAEGNTAVDQVLEPQLTSTRTEPKPRRGPPSSRTSSSTSSGSVTKTHDPVS